MKTIMIKGNVERIAATEAQSTRLKAEGYRVITASTQTVEEEKTQSQTALEDMTAAELKALAKERGLSGYSALSKEDLLAVLKDVV